MKIGVFALSLVPLASLLFHATTDRLGANPIERIIHVTGWWALAFLLIGLAVTPLRQWFGLFAFFYAGLHVLSYLGLDQFFDWAEILRDIGKRPYITVGFAAFLLLIPLALTSTDGMIRRLGGRRWKHLHKLVYPIAIAGVLHFGWLVKKDITEPAGFGAILVVLLTARLVRGARQHAPKHRDARIIQQAG